MIRSHPSFRIFIILTLIVFLVPAAGCTPRSAAAIDLISAPQTAAESIITAQGSPVPMAAGPGNTDSSMGEIIENQGPEALSFINLEPPLRFTFPAYTIDYVSAWRPPLVPVPWALTPNDHYYFIRPIAADNVNWPSADYRYGDLFPDKDIIHTGVDIAADLGTPILAAGPGKVTWAGEGLYKGLYADDDPYGIAVAIRHDFGYKQREVYTIYAHMDRVDVVVGQRIAAGDQVGIVGSTGQTTGPHLHFEVRIKDNSFFASRNPELWLAPPQGWGVLVGRLIGRYGFPVDKIKVYVTSLDNDQVWVVRTYGPSSVNCDDYYQENLVLSDLPAGKYRIDFRLNWRDYQHIIEIKPGATTFFNFNERPGVFSDEVPEKNLESIFTPVFDMPSANP